MQGMTPAQFIDYRNRSEVEPLLLDIRETWEHEICHIECSRLLPMSGLSAQLHHMDKGRPTVVVCHHGIRSLQVAHYLSKMGFDQVFNLEGGIAAWASEMDPDMPSY